MGALLVLVLMLGPLVIAPGFSFYFDITPKVICILGGTALALMCFLAGSGDTGRVLRTTSGKWLCVLLAAQGLSLAISTAASYDPALSLSGTNWRRFGLVVQVSVLVFAFLLAVHVSSGPGRVKSVLRAITIAGLPASLYGILQYFGWDPFLPERAYHIGEGIWTIVRPPGTLGYASYLATYCLYVVFAGIALERTETVRGWRALGVVAALTAATSIVLSGTRAGILGLFVGGLLLALMSRPRLGIRLAISAGLVVALSAFYFSSAGTKLRSRTRWYLEDPLGGARLTLWRDSARMGASRLAAGYGPETFSSTFPRFQSVDLARAYPNFYHESPHNVFLDAFSAQGAPGLAILFGLAALALYAARGANIAASGFVAPLSAGLAAAMLSQQFTSFILVTALYLWGAVALLVSLDVRCHTSDTTEKSAKPRSLLTICLCVAATVVFAIFALRLFVSDRALAVANRSLESGDLAQAAAVYEKARRSAPPGVSSDLWYSRKLASSIEKSSDLALRLRSFREAFAAAVRATQEAEDKHNAWYNLAVFYGAQNDAAGTERSLRAAIQTAPQWFKPHWTLAQVLSAEGRWREAEAEAALAADLNGGKDREVAQTLKEIRMAARAGGRNSRR